MTPKRFLLPLAALLLLVSPFAQASSYHATDDPDLVHEAEVGDIPAASATLKADPLTIDKANDQGHAASATLKADPLTIDKANDQGHTPLMRAAEHGHPTMIKLLLDNGAVVNRADSLGKTALIWAAEGGDPDCIDLLIKAGARLEQSTKEGITPLMAAARTGQVDAVVRLLAAGAQADRSDYSGRDVLGWAQESHNSRVIELLRKAQKH